MSSAPVEELAPSQLGTKSYWDGCYEKEIENFDSHGDVGEVWFGEEAGVRVVNWLSEKEQEGEISTECWVWQWCAECGPVQGGVDRGYRGGL